MKTFDEFTRKFFVPDDRVPVVEDDTSDDSEFVIPECWKPKTFSQSIFLNYALNAGPNSYPNELLAAIRDCVSDFLDQHTINETEILFDGNLNFTITVGENTIATSDNFSLATEVDTLIVDIAVDGENLPSVQSESYTGMTAMLMSAESVNPDVHSCFVRLSNLANTFADGAHHVVLSVVTQRTDLEPKTYKELVFAGGKTSPIVENKMLPKTPEELAFALLTGAPLQFADDDVGTNIGDLIEHGNS